MMTITAGHLLAAGVIGFGLAAAGMFTLALCGAAANGDRIAENARRDVAARGDRSFSAWDADTDLPSFERHAGGWRR